MGLHKQIQEVQQVIALTDEVFDPVQTLRCRLGRQARHGKQTVEMCAGCGGGFSRSHTRVKRENENADSAYLPHSVSKCDAKRTQLFGPLWHLQR
jgi:hypothetical protein